MHKCGHKCRHIHGVNYGAQHMLLLALESLTDKDGMGWVGVVVGGKETKRVHLHTEV